ncbi:MAG: CDP-diacylglycerol--serine O-phosphatidyltransferase [Thermodesulfobacteriota bacterium]
MPSPNRNRRHFFTRRKRSASPQDPTVKAMKRQKRINNMKKGIFILPSLLTLSSIFCGFYSLVAAFKGDFLLSAGLIVAAAFFDGVDGKVARLTKTSTKFGLELDSLADVISFGVAPAFLLYVWALEPFHRLGWVTAFVFVACGALRLARFNVQVGSIDSRRFNGLPIPAAASMVATTVMFFRKVQINPNDYGVILLLACFVLSFLMVSSVKFYAFKEFTVVKDKPFSSTVAFVLILAPIAAFPLIVPFFMFLGYVLSGPITTVVWKLQSRKREREQAEESAKSIPEPDSGAPMPGTGGKTAQVLSLKDHSGSP